MGVINVLSKQVSELIAAGEVIERPGSVIKELVENSIDAQATSITVEIKNGGVTFMRVTDNGIGIQREDVRTAFLRHATSKIAQQNDLDSILTLGFRGEALASICAVSKVEVITKNINEDDGVRYELQGGEEKSFETIGCPQGTTFIVRDLFYNVPARMKFLKKDVAESNNISTLIDRIALSHPEIGFTFIRDGKQILKTSGNGNLGMSILQVFGKQFSSSLIPISYEHQGIKIDGYVSKPVSANRASRNMQIFFVNGRYVKTKTAMAALEQAYSGFIMTGKFPACVINIQMNSSNLDVNVHPAKLEIRFTDEKPIYECVYYAVKSAISSYDTRQKQDLESDFISADTSAVFTKPLNFGVQTNLSVNQDKPNIYIPETSGFKTGSDYSAPINDDIKSINLSETNTDNAVINEPSAIYETAVSQPVVESETNFVQTADEQIPSYSEQETPNENNFSDEISCLYSEQSNKAIKYIGEVFRSYIIIEYDDDRIMFIDKHAAHERLIYEQLKRQHTDSSPQILLEPLMITLDKVEYQTVLENKDILLKAGFDVDDFGNGTLLVRSVPLLLEKLDITEAFLEISDYLQKHKKVILSEKMEWIYQNTACRAAIKAGNHNKPEELINLALTLEKNPEIRYCPHGRPIYFFLSKREIEKNFKRI